MSHTELDFGEVETFGIGFVRIEVTNDSPQVRELRSGTPQPPFSLSPPLHASGIQLASERTRNLEVQFRPTDALLHLGSLELSAGDDCTATISLRGLGSGSAELVPKRLDFGFVDPGQQKTLEVQLVNSRRAPVVGSLSLRNVSGVFSGDVPPSIELPPLSSTSLFLTASPPRDETFRGELLAVFQAGVSRVELQVVGGTPVAEVSPAAIAVPIVGFTPGVPPLRFSERVVRVRNVGTLGQSVEAQLRLLPPFVRVESFDGGAADELVLVDPPPDAGLPRDGGIELLLRLTPNAPGPRSYQLTVFTNDPVRPEQVLTYDTDVQVLAPCVVRIEPQGELALTPMPDGRSKGTVSFLNEGTTPCVVDDIRLTASTPGSFKLLNAPAQLLVQPGETGTILVDGPRTVFSNTGQLSFHVFNPNGGRQVVPLRAPP